MALKVGELFASFSIDSSSLDSSLSQITKQCDNIGSTMMKAGVGLSAAVTAPITKAAKDMYSAGTEFEAQMSKVQAIAGLDSQIAADAEAIQALTDKALEMGSTTEWTAKQSGEALEYMAMAGWKTDSMLSALPSVMNLATAAGADLGKTSDIVTDAMTAFGLTMSAAGGDTEVFTGYVEHFTDVLAAAATNSNTNVELLGTSFKYVAPLAGSLGMKVDDVAVALGLMANAGVKSTTAGASLRNIISGLMGPTKKTAEACETLGVSLFDANGKTKDLATIMQDLRGAATKSGVNLRELQAECAKLDEQLASGQISQDEYNKQMEKLTEGSGDFMTACVNLAGKQGLSGLLAIMNASDEDFQNLTEAIADCDGATAQMAATMLDNAKGAVTIFKSAIEGLEITLWNLVAESFTDVVKGATEIVDQFRKMDSGTQLAIMKFAGLAAAAGPVLIAGGKLVKMLPGLVKGIAALSSPLGIVAGGLALFAVAAIDTDNTLGKLFTDSTKKLKKTLKTINSSLQTNMKSVSDRMGALCESIVEGIHNVLPQAVKTLMLLIDGFVQTIAVNASNIAEIGKTIIVDICNGIAKYLPMLMKHGAKMMTNLATAIIDNAPSILDAVLNIVKSIGAGFEQIDWAGNAKKIIDSIRNAFEGTTEVFDKWFDDMQAFATDSLDWASIGNEIVDLILGATVDIADMAGDFFTNLIEGLGKFNGWSSIGSKLGVVAEHLITGIADAIPKLSSTISKIIDAIGDALSGDGMASLEQGIQAIALAIANGLKNAIPKIEEAASNIIGSITDTLNKINFDDIAAVAVAIGDAVIDGVVQGVESAADLAVTITEAIGNLLSNGNFADKLIGAAGHIATSLIDSLSEAIPKVGDAAVSIFGAIGDLLASDSITSFTNSLSNVANSIITSLVNAIPNVSNAATNIINAICDLITGDAGTNLIYNFGTFATSLISGIVDAIPKVAGAAVNIIDAIGKILSGNKTDAVFDALTSVATSVVNGIIDGIPKVANAAVNIISAIGKLFTDEGAGTKIANGAINIAKSILTAVVDGIPKITDAAVSIITAIGQLFTGDTASTGITGGAVNIATSILNAVIDCIPKVANAAVNIIGAIGSLFSADGAGTQIASGALNIATSIVSAVIEGIPKITNAAVDIINAIGSLFTAGGDGSQFRDQAFAIAQSLIESITSAIPTLAQSASSIVTAIGDALGGYDWGGLVGDLSSLGQAVVNAIIAGINGIQDIGVSVIEAVGNMFARIDWDNVSVNLEGFANMLLNGIKNGIQALTELDVSLYTALGDLFANADWSKMGDVTSSLASTLISGLVEGLKTAFEGAGQIITAIAEALGKIEWKDVANAVSSLAQTIFDGIVEGAKTLTPDMAELMAAIGRGIVAAASALAEVAGTLIENIVKFVISPENWVKLVELGATIIQGIANGIISLGEGILKGAFDIMDNVLVGLLRGLGFEIDEQTAETMHSMATVIDENGDVVVQSYESMCTQLTDRANPLYDVYDTNTLNSVLSMYNACMETGNKSIISQLDNYAFLSDQGIVNMFQTLVSETSTQSQKAAALIALNDLGLGGYVSDQFLMANEEIVTAAANMGSMTSEEFIKAFEGLGGVIPGAIKTGLQSGEVTVQEAAKKITEIASTANAKATAEADAKTTGDAVTTNLAKGENAGKSTVESAAQGVVDAATVALQTLPDSTAIMGKDAVTGIGDSITNNKNVATTAMDTAADEIVKAALNKLTYDDGYKGGYDYTNAIIEGIAAAITEGNESVTTESGKIAKAIKDAMKEELTQKEGGSVIKDYMDGIKAELEGADNILPQEAEAIARDIDSAIRGIVTEAAGKEIGSDFSDGVKNAFKDNHDNVVGEASNFATETHNALFEQLNEGTGSNMGFSYTNAIYGAFNSNVENFKTAANSLGSIAKSSIETFLNYSNGQYASEIFVSGVVNGLYSGCNSAYNNAWSLTNTIRNVFYDVLGSGNGWDIGYYFVDGIANGIYWNQSRAINAAIDVARNALRAAKNELGIRSPSKVARDEIGMMYDNGIIVGLKKGMPSVSDAASKVSKELHDSFYVGDTSRGTVYTSQQQANRIARETAQVNNDGSAADRANAIGRAIADRLIESGVLDSDVYMDGSIVGRKVSKPVSEDISRKGKSTIAGRSLQGVIG